MHKEGLQRDKPEEITLKYFGEDWLKTKKPVVRPKTYRSYESTVERLNDYFDNDMLLCKVTARLAAKFIAELKRLDKKKNELSNWTRHKTLRNCKLMFQTGVTWELIAKNPFKAVSTPKLATKRWHYLKPDEYRRLLEVAPSLRWKALYALAYTASLRFGELFSLTWSDIDFETGGVRIENRPVTSTMPPFYVKDYEA